MAKSISALHGHMKKGRYGAPGKPGVSIKDVPVVSMVQFSAWPDTVSEFAKIVSRSSGLRSVPAPGQIKSGKSGSLLRVEPLKWWFLSDNTAPSLKPVSSDIGVVLDLSSSRNWLKVFGPEAATLLSHFLPLDFRTASFPENHVASTGFHHIGVTVWRDGDGFNLLLPRSFALSLWEMIEASARQYGLEVK